MIYNRFAVKSDTHPGLKPWANFYVPSGHKSYSPIRDKTLAVPNVNTYVGEALETKISSVLAPEWLPIS
jgi:hypothetical protein